MPGRARERRICGFLGCQVNDQLATIEKLKEGHLVLAEQNTIRIEQVEDRIVPDYTTLESQVERSYWATTR